MCDVWRPVSGSMCVLSGGLPQGVVCEVWLTVSGCRCMMSGGLSQGVGV